MALVRMYMIRKSRNVEPKSFGSVGYVNSTYVLLAEYIKYHSVSSLV